MTDHNRFNTRHARTGDASAALVALCDVVDSLATALSVAMPASVPRADRDMLVDTIDRAAAKVEAGQAAAARAACSAARQGDETLGDSIAIDALMRAELARITTCNAQ